MAILIFLEIPEWLPYVAAIVVISGAIFGIQTYFAHRRTQALIPVASQIGFAFEGKAWSNPQQAPKLTSALFQMGRGKDFRNIMTGSANGLPVGLFDYAFTVGGGKSSRTYKQTVFSCVKAGAHLPMFKLWPKDLSHKLWDAMVHKDILFDTHPEFSNRYQLSGPDETRIRGLFTAGLLSYLETLDKKMKWRIEGNEETLLVYRSAKKTKPQDFRTFLDETSTMAAQFLSLGNWR